MRNRDGSRWMVAGRALRADRQGREPLYRTTSRHTESGWIVAPCYRTTARHTESGHQRDRIRTCPERIGTCPDSVLIMFRLEAGGADSLRVGLTGPVVLRGDFRGLGFLSACQARASVLPVSVLKARASVLPVSIFAARASALPASKLWGLYLARRRFTARAPFMGACWVRLSSIDAFRVRVPSV